MARCLVMGARVPRRDVDDITQEVLCVLAFHREPLELPSCRAPRTPEQARAAMIAAATRWQLAEHARRQARLRTGDVLGAEVFSSRATPSAEDLSVSLAGVESLCRALAKLEQTEPALHAVLDLTANGASIASAAMTLGIPAGTACTRLRRARALMHQYFRRDARSRGAAGFA